MKSQGASDNNKAITNCSDRALVVVQHREVEAVRIGNVAQLSARCITFTGSLYLDHVGTEPGEQLRAGRSGLDVGEIKDANAV